MAYASGALESIVTEFGRRGSVLASTGAFTITVLAGLFSNGDLAYIAVLGLVAALVFGIGGLLIGNLLHSYVIRAANREAARRSLEKQIARDMAAAKAEEEESGEAETVAAGTGPAE